MPLPEDSSLPIETGAVERRSTQHIARVMLATFLLTFLAARIVVFLIMDRRLPILYLHLGQTHVHHLNYGIFLLAGIGAYLLLMQPSGKNLTVSAVVYAIGLALTFDEFGMWLHLGGAYWQRASFDAVVVIAAMLGLVVLAPVLRRFKPSHWAVALALVLAFVVFAILLVRSVQRYANHHIVPALQNIELHAPD